MPGAGDSTFGDLLRRLRTDEGLTQEELAERAGLSTRGISDLERGINRWPFRATVQALLEALAPSEADADELRERAARPRSPRTATETPTRIRLPVPPTPILGREWEEAKALHILRWEGKRLLTLTGTGGAGKTRLALQIAWTAREDYADGAAFVSLAAVSDPSLIPASVAAALGIGVSGTTSAETAVADFIGDREMLVVLDNLEHILPGAPFIAELLSGCPRLKVLATSREPLKLRGEQELNVAPLPVPDAGLSCEELRNVSSVRLFLQRAQSVRADLELTSENGDTVAEISRRLDGLPLAIELAAAQVKYFSPHALLAQLDKRLDTLAGGARDLPPRQQTLRDTIAWSYYLLQPRDQLVFRHMAVFRGGCTEKAVDAVLEAPGSARRALHDLADKSLVLIQTDDVPRYRMLETIREFGLEQLIVAGEADGARRGHARYFLELAQDAEPELTGPRQGEWLDRLEAEYDNLREALSWANSDADFELGLELCVSLRHFWPVRGRTGEGRTWTATFLEGMGETVPAPLRAAALYAAGTMAYGQELYGEAEQAFQRSLSLFRDLGDRVRAARALNGLGVIAYERGQYGVALPALEEAVQLYREAGAQDQLGAPLNNMANIALYTGELHKAVQLYEDCIALYDELGNDLNLANSLNNLALAVQGTGDRDRARDLATRSLALYRDLGVPSGQAVTLATLSAIALDEGANAQAQPLILESLALAQESGARVTVADALINLSTVEFRQGSETRAEELARDALALAEENGVPRTAAYALDNLGDIARSRGSRHEARGLYEESLRLRRRVGDLTGVVDSLERLASLACTDGAWEDAVTGYAAADAVRERTGLRAGPFQQCCRERDIDRARSVMHPDAFDAAWATGRGVGERDLRRA